MFSPLCITEADGWGPTLQSGGNQLIGLREIDMVPAPNPSSPPHSPSVLLCNYPIDWLVLIAGLIIAGFRQLPSQQLSSEVNKYTAYTPLQYAIAWVTAQTGGVHQWAKDYSSVYESELQQREVKGQASNLSAVRWQCVILITNYWSGLINPTYIHTYVHTCLGLSLHNNQ